MLRWALPVLLPCLLVGCDTNAVRLDEDRPRQPLRLSPGQVAVLPDTTTLRYVGITQTPSCDCGDCTAWGPPAALFELAHGDAEETEPFLIHITPPLSVRGTKNWHIRLMDVGPGPNPVLVMRFTDLR